MRAKTILIICLVLSLLNLGIGLYVGYQFNNKKDIKPAIDYWNPNYLTTLDSLKIELSKALSDTSGYSNIKPKAQYVYLPPIPGKSLQSITCSLDSLQLILDSVTNELIKIPTTFLTSFPYNPKLIEGYFSKDTLTLSLFYPNGSSSKYLFEMDYQNYRYLWQNNNMKATKIESKPDKSKNKNTYNSLWVNSGIISYASSPFIDLSYEFHYKKMKIETKATYLITPNLPLISVGLGYKLK